MQHTGFLYKFDPKDYITGASPLVIPDVNTTGDWQLYQPNGEKQYKQATFDTYSCTTYSALNIIETWVMWHKANNQFTTKQLETLNTLGFFADGKFNCSDRFTASMSNTMPNGNYFPAVLDSIRKDGLLPEALHTFGGNNQLEYLDKTKITEDMKTTAKKILDILDISYEWTAIETIPADLKKCPIQGAIPQQASHAIEIIAPGLYFDSYEPYIKPLGSIGYAMKIIVNIKKEMPKYKYFSEKEVAGLKHELVSKLDAIRGAVGFPMVITSGLRTKAQNDALKDSASNSGHLRGYEADIACTDSAKRDMLIQASYEYGITRRGIGNGFIHLGVDPSLPQNVMWTYYK